ncbi:adhesion G-protein coupled receptor G1 [Hemicordylus capensis]|uniref:adhesion G-protein coupled receptor G1 n=1 Tax=Hemicordylus capensis TaxID=884348 RepID=UPI00230268DF|nr:adhesion G-protein coupled receptor G1 [Hemicordylus capensis]XP_053127497.1 adhesion G-protein coupled receptor G1 [Hemicordylus capensis]XP_053127498.1 adhesion G-protein coupled receptor G1 [Hemicordylus capensis]
MPPALSELPRRLFFLLTLLSELQGIHGSNKPEYDFRFCGWRNHSKKSQIQYAFQDGAIKIANGADVLSISAPFSLEDKGSNLEPGTWDLPDHKGTYRFCVYWSRDTRLFSLTYGITNKYNLSTKAYYSLCHSIVSEDPNQASGDVIFNASYTTSKLIHNQSLPNASVYSFVFRDEQTSCVQDSDVAELQKKLEAGLKHSIKGRKGILRTSHKELQRLESDLGVVRFEGENKTFGKGTLLQATVFRIPQEKTSRDLSIESKLEENKEVHGFEVSLPKNVFAKSKGRSRSGERRVVLMDISSQIPFPDQNSSRLLGEKVLGISVGSSPIHGLPKDQRVALTFWHKPLPRNVMPQCVFWDAGSNESRPGFWNTSGCEVARELNRTTCFCDHLTFFAVLMMSSPDVDIIHQQYLTIITYVGCIVSAASCFVTIIFFLCSRQKQRDHIVYIHTNLLVAIFILDMSFLIAVPLAPAGGNAACKAGAMLLHFALLACLTWMGIEGYSLYQLVIEVFNSYVQHFLLKLCLVGWGLPILLVALIFGIKQSYYGQFSIKVYESSERYTNATICWITETHINNILNLGLLSLVLLFNSIMLAAMVREILKLRHRDHQWKYALMLLGLSCVLGIPWGLVFFSFTSGTFRLVAVYLSTIINSLQGFLIFLWTLAKVLQARKSSSMQCTSSNSANLQSSNTSL